MSRVVGCRVLHKGEEVPTEAMHLVTVEKDLDQPDMCLATLANTKEHKYSANVTHGDELEVKIGSTAEKTEAIFKGEVVGIEPVYETGGETRVVLRAFSKLHRLTRSRKSRTFMKMSDPDIASKIANEYSLTPKVSKDVNIKYEHVYQHNQTDLEFLLVRAARIGYEVFCEDKELVFRKRNLAEDSGIEVRFGDESAEFSLQRFMPRLSTAMQVKEVTVHGWDPDTHKEIIGKATSVQTKLGGKIGPEVAKAAFGDHMTAEVEIPVVSKEEADVLAKAKLEDLLLSYITGEGQCLGNPKLKPGIIVKVTAAREDDLDARFGGKYYLTGVTHRYTHKGKGGGGGYITMIRFRRNAEA